MHMEGVVTALATANRFTLNDQVVVVSAATRFDDLTVSDLALNMALEVEGAINQAGELLASRVAAQHVRDGRTLMLEGNVLLLQPDQKTFTLPGGVLQVDNASMLLLGRDADQRQTSGSFASIKVGDFVRVEAVPQSDGSLRVLRLDWGHRRCRLLASSHLCTGRDPRTEYCWLVAAGWRL
ncbi:MAG: hypothetical protein HZT40_22410 [Candidatus Thiothrix singaporensis]|uniref:DUF5666 domain-containing protein n=1 Tax=Candidatus Thiothrix singaporensis TaxID=2799669 RepID=A0A7L6AXP0_9GAMM|nr:MAG: hypothetical protein HZT40_22410 [Candidatus Thiothrix singaporensis]